MHDDSVTDWWDDWSPPGNPQMPADGELGIALRDARERVVMSQRELARKSGLSQPVVSRIERGHRSSWPVFCRLIDAMGLEPVVTTRRRMSDLDREVERLATMSADHRLSEQQLILEWLPRKMPSTGWALDGDAALIAYGVPVMSSGLLIAVLDEPDVQAQLEPARNDRFTDFVFRRLPTLPPLVHVKAGEAFVPLMPLGQIDLGERGSQERNDREAALEAYARSLTASWR